MRKPIQQFALLCCLFVTSTTLLAANKIKVELLIFEQLASPTFEDHMSNTHPGLPDFAKAIYLKTSKAANYRLLSYKYYSLGNAKAQLAKRGNYRTLKHVAWIQPAESRRESKYIHISGGDKLNETEIDGNNYNLRELQGIVQISQSKYPHIDLDLILREATGQHSSPYFSDSTGYWGSTNDYQTYRLSEKQRLKYNKIFYIDHPKLGVIVKVSKYPS